MPAFPFNGSATRMLTLNEDFDEFGRLMAQVWAPTDVPAMDLRAGHQGRDAFSPDKTVTCDYIETKQGGSTHKID